MKKIAGWLVVLGGVYLTMGIGNVRAACNGVLTCQVFNEFLGGCTSVGADTIPCVDNGTACVWESACQTCPAFGGDCSGTSGGGGGTSTACGNAAAPACQGACSGGLVCRNVSGGCACRTANSCDDYVNQPGDITITRVSPTSASLSWNPPSNTNNPYIGRQSLIITTSNAALNADCAGQYASQCAVYESNLASTVSSYDATGVLEAGRYYYVRLTWYSNLAPGWGAACKKNANENYLSSCILTPDPLAIDVGTSGSLETQVSNDVAYVVNYDLSPGNIASRNPNNDALYPYRTTVTGVAEGTTTATGEVRLWQSGAYVSMCSDTATVNVGNVVPPNTGLPWWQVVGGGVYAGDSSGGLSIRSEVPAGEYLLIPGSIGSVAALMRASGTYEVGSGDLSVSAWNALTRYRGKRIDYAYFAAQLGVGSSQANDWGSDDLDQPVYDPGREFYYQNPATEVTLGGWSVQAGEKYVVVVRGNVRITGDVTVANGGYLMVIAQGDVTVDPAVTTVQGIYLANGLFITESAGVGGDVQLVVSGSVAAWDGVDLNRDLGVVGNASPAEQFVYRPDLMTTMPKKVKTFVMEWQEVPAGTFGN